MEKTNLFSNTYGIQGFLQPQPRSNFPSAKPLASTASNEIAVVEHFNLQDIAALSERFLTPYMGDGSALRPDNFNRNLIAFANKFAESEDQEVREFVNSVLNPVIKNKELLHAYTHLMVGG